MDDLKLIKKHYGEEMMHLCRELFPTILETPGLLYDIIYSHFPHSKFLYHDIIKVKDEFKKYIMSLVFKERDLVRTNKDPFELMQEAGYTLYECFTKDDIQYFRKYYASGEELCTFKYNRLASCYVFFAVKNNVDEIKREDFLIPKRQDDYGTSVISIQISKNGGSLLSIKNRYNNMVDNPDATFSNNLENIILGLTDSFQKKLDIRFISSLDCYFYLPGYVRGVNGKYYKVNNMLNNYYFCQDNVIIDCINFDVIDTYKDKEKYVFADFFIIDLVNKKIILDDWCSKDDLFDEFKDVEKIEIIKNKETGNKDIIFILKDGIKRVITIDKFNRIISCVNSNLLNIRDYILKQKSNQEWLDLAELSMDDNWMSVSKKFR